MVAMFCGEMVIKEAAFEDLTSKVGCRQHESKITKWSRYSVIRVVCERQAAALLCQR